MKHILKALKAFENFIFFSKIEGLFKVHQSFMTYKCGAMYVVF